MLIHEFFDRFEHLPINRKFETIDQTWHGDLNLNEVYLRLMRLDAQRRTIDGERDDLLKIAGDYLDSLPKPKLDYRE